MFEYIELSFEERSSVETEIRFLLATASVDKLELLAIAFKKENEAVDKRKESAIKRTLNTLKKEGKVTFFVNYDLLENGSTESEFLKNKYQAFLTKRENDVVFFVKI